MTAYRRKAPAGSGRVERIELNERVVYHARSPLVNGKVENVGRFDTDRQAREAIDAWKKRTGYVAPGRKSA